ncbi:YjzC family protein [Corallococcus sp. CA054B]|uniref:YjzC family protein n=1 Tax=Corallococcus sp. CA054B TaxID=2316734 RepID=UPI000EA2B4D7|nr:YjzC family protein [Corallococcus sp. CA054B]RKG61268.1 YjzC family protein [Corallococcus sp. CA054B]
MAKGYKTGDTYETSGDYAFDGYTDGTESPPVTQEERIIPLDKDETFPPIKSSKKGAYWTKV